MTTTCDKPLRWAFAGCKPQGFGILTALREAGFVPEFCVCPPGRSEEDGADIGAFCRMNGCDLHHSLRMEGFEKRLAPLDLLLVCRFEMLAPVIFTAPRLGAVNVHSSLLPRYRGVHPVSWALINGERMTGVTLHQIARGMDTGGILAQHRVDIEDDDDLWTLTGKLDAASALEAVALFKAIERTGCLPAEEPQDGEASYAPRRTPEEGRIDWTLSARAVFNLIRALPPPLPGAFGHDEGGGRVTFRQAALSGRTHQGAVPGTVASVDDENTVEIICGDGQGVIARADRSLPMGISLT